MCSNSWQQRSDCIRFREDEFSWQGAHFDDPRVFLRRSKDDPSEITDLLLGSLSEKEALAVIVDFLTESGGLPTLQVRLSSIGRVKDSHEDTVANYDGLIAIMRAVISALGYNCSNAFLEKSGNMWDAVIDVNESTINPPKAKNADGAFSSN